MNTDCPLLLITLSVIEVNLSKLMGLKIGDILPICDVGKDVAYTQICDYQGMKYAEVDVYFCKQKDKALFKINKNNF